MEAAGAVGAGGAIVYASGFSETGKPDRVRQQDELVEVARRTGVRMAREAGKALIVYKAGDSAASAEAALSHTGTMVGSAAAYRAAFDRVGAVGADDLELVLEWRRSSPVPGPTGAAAACSPPPAARPSSARTRQRRMASRSPPWPRTRRRS